MDEILTEILNELKQIKVLLAPHDCSASNDSKTYKLTPYEKEWQRKNNKLKEGNNKCLIHKTLIQQFH